MASTKWTSAEEQAILDNPTCTNAEVARAIGRTTKAVVHHRSQMRHKGHVVRVKYVAYRPRKCLDCPTWFTPTGPHEPRCSPCGQKRYQQQRQVYHREQYERWKDTPFRIDRSLVPPTKGFSDLKPWIEAIAEAHGVRLEVLSSSFGLGPSTLRGIIHDPRNPQHALSEQSCRKISAATGAEIGELDRLRLSDQKARFGKGGWDTHKKTEQLGKRYSQPRKPGTGERIREGQKASPKHAVWRAKILLASCARRTRLDWARLADLWPSHRIKTIAGALGATERSVQINLAEMSERGLISPPVPYPRGAPTLSQLEEAQHIVNEAQVEPLKDKREKGNLTQHEDARARYVATVKDLRGRGERQTRYAIRKTSKQLFGKELGQTTLDGLMKECPPDDIT